MLVKELKKLAREYKIPGRSKMKKKSWKKQLKNILKKKSITSEKRMKK